MKEVSVGSRKKWEDSIKKDSYVLDVGCWSGRKLVELLPKTKNGYGIDIDRKRLKMADPKIKKNIKYFDITQGVPFNNKFDYVIFSEVLEHVSDDDKALRNISDSMKVGGVLILTTPRSVPGFQMWDPAWFRWKFLRGQRHYHYTEEELIEKLKRNNLEIEEYYISGNLKWVFFRWLTVFLNYVLRINKKVSLDKEVSGFCDWVLLVKKTK